MLDYRWHDAWARIPEPVGEHNLGRTHGVGALRDGRLVVFHQAKQALLTFDSEGTLVSAAGTDWLGAHGLSIVLEGSQETLWLTDEFSGRVARTDLAGKVLQELPKPEHADYADQTYSPTLAVQHPIDGRVYVADGYGASLVHVYDREGVQRATWDGTAGAGRFREPHGIGCVPSAAGVEIWVADRGNHRIQIFDADGRFLRSSMACHSPCMFAAHDGLVAVPELFTGVKLLDATQLTVVQELGVNPDVKPHADPAQWWPPRAPANWPDLPLDSLRPGIFNSPHAACFASNGDLYVVEWIVGGRIIKLERC